jgi:pimeloyl-ACP methyl ester carboxylesterase
MSDSTTPDTPTVVLIHGAFADASSWTRVIGELLADDIAVVAPPNPLRGLTTDSDYVASVVDQISGPVVLVGHSYGGAVITRVHSQRVTALVYVAAFAPDEGESLLDIIGRSSDVPLGSALRPRPYRVTGQDEPGTEFLIDPASFHPVFCADLPAEQASVMALTQRPAAVEAFATPMSGPPSWRTLPSWFVVASEDNAIHPEAQRSMSKRASSTVVEIQASHAVALSQPDAVSRVIRDAVEAVTSPARTGRPQAGE